MLNQPTITSANNIQAYVSQTGPINTSIKKGFGFVYSVILDETHPVIKNSNGLVSVSYIGAIQFRYSDDNASDDGNLSVAFPFDKTLKSLPLRNETVEIYKSGGAVMYRRIGQEISPNTNSDEKNLTRYFGTKAKLNDTVGDYNNVQSTGITKTNINETAELDGFGKYFKAEKGIHRLKMYEGDMLVESRFGQSIRFSGYNNPTNTFSPTIIIRNSESDITRKKTVEEAITEDVNWDGSIIALTSKDYELPFKPGIVSEAGISDFQTKPDTFDGYPQKLVGDQILLNSGRIILSAKNGEMIFYSKKNYGFISDGGMSIDNAAGIDVSVGGNINVMTNSNDVAFFTDNGSIFLGNTELEPLVKGQQLVNLLAELIDTIVAQQYLTPSGPTKIGPENVQKFGSIKQKLNNILSKLNQTS
jgi:hypothetical protein